MEDEAAHGCCPSQSQTHSALHTLSLSDLDLQMRVTGANPAAEFLPLYGFATLDWRKHPTHCIALLPFHLKVFHPQVMVRIAKSRLLGAHHWGGAQHGMAWKDEQVPSDLSLSGIWKSVVPDETLQLRGQRRQDWDAYVKFKSKQK